MEGSSVSCRAAWDKSLCSPRLIWVRRLYKWSNTITVPANTRQDSAEEGLMACASLGWNRAAVSYPK